MAMRLLKEQTQYHNEACTATDSALGPTKAAIIQYPWAWRIEVTMASR
jgi:hypothetical protein